MLAITNISQLAIPTTDSTAGPQGAIRTIADAAILVDGELIVAVGHRSDVDWPVDTEVVDARGRCVVSGLIDCHTHTVFAGSREDEFVKRIEGKSYTQIAEEGGGIKTTVRDVRAATVDELVELALPRLRRMLANGVTTVEIKSGYGLSVDDEIKMLTAAIRLRDRQPMDIVTTYLGAHTLPVEYANDRKAYLDLVCSDELLGRIARDGLAEFCDVFTERTAFNIDESRRVLNAAKAVGLTPKLHADQITQFGASRLAAEVGAISADHLETIDRGGIESMKEAGVIAVLLPGCSWFLGVPQAPAREILDAGLRVAIATDYNPGSSMVESLPLVMAIACTQMRLTPEEVLLAVTTQAAAALGRSGSMGCIAAGEQADLVILDVPNYNQWMYNPGRNCVQTVIKRGRVAYSSID
jgi:imidazolonepropionase